MKKVTIYSTGSCDASTRMGSYAIRIEFKGKSKLFTNVISDTTANRCIIHGCIAGIEKLTESCEVEFITAAPMGISTFKKGKGVNKDYIQKLFDILHEKKCDFEFTVKEGEGGWVKDKIHGV